MMRLDSGLSANGLPSKSSVGPHHFADAVVPMAINWEAHCQLLDKARIRSLVVSPSHRR